MSHVAVIGAGLGGLAAALFLARRGHDVDLFERDSEDPPPDPRAAFDVWTRRGVAQARHGHGYFALSSQVLREEAPDLLTSFVDAGAIFAKGPFSIQLPGFETLAMRRLPFESVVRHAVCAEPRIALHRGATIEGLVWEAGATAPHVVGVRTADGQECRVDLVVDASGRWTRGAEWLANMGARPWREQAADGGFVYLTRYFRLKRDVGYPPSATGADLSYGQAMVFPADCGTYAVTFVTSTDEPHRAMIARNEKFDAVMRAIPSTAAWIDAGVPINDVQVLGRLDNRARALVDEHGPIVTGYVLIADAAMCTNPRFGRGVSLAFAHARRLAETIERATEDPLAFTIEFHDWTRKNIGVWYAGTVKSDASKSARMQRAFRGEDAPPEPEAFLIPTMNQLIQEDSALAEKWFRLVHLLDPPQVLFSDPATAARIQAYVRNHPEIVPPDGLPRRDFELILAG